MNNEKFTFFWRDTWFNQWSWCAFQEDGIDYICPEQYMMAKKAELFGDKYTQHKIMESTNPKEQKALGRKVSGFNQSIWDKHCKQIVYKGNLLKFTQNKKFRDKLFATVGTTLVEASPFDRVWGVGLTETDPLILDRKNWQGTNYLGEILTKLRDDLLRNELASEPKIAIGFDVHGVLDAKPKLFSTLSNLLVLNGHEVHILTGSRDTPEIRDELDSYGIKYTHFFSISDYNKEIGTKMWNDENGNPWMDQEVWNKTKADYCRRNNIDLHFDDTIQYGDHFTTPFARFFSKHVNKKVRENILPNEEALL